MDFPDLATRTRRFSLGVPRAVTVTHNGDRVVYLRSLGPTDPVDRLWAFDVSDGTHRLVADPTQLGGTTGLVNIDAPPVGARPVDALPVGERALRERQRLTATGIGSFALDAAGVVATFTASGTLFRADTGTGDVVAVPSVGPVVDPRPDPTGTRIAYVTNGELHVVSPDGTDALLAGEQGVTWGMADFIAAEEFARFRGFWWAPSSDAILAARVNNANVPRWHLHDPASPASAPIEISYPHAGAPNADVGLHLLHVDGGWVDVHWDRQTYPYLAAVSWEGSAGPLITVLRRLQQHALVLVIDRRTGETQVHAELADARWVSLVPGTPRWLPDGRVLVGGDLAREGNDSRCLFADGSLVTPPWLYVRRVCGLSGDDLIVEGSEGEPSEQHVYRVRVGRAAGPAGTGQARRITSAAGWHTAAVGGDTVVIGSAGLDHPGLRYTVHVSGREVGSLESVAAAPPYAPRPALQRVTDRRLPTGVLYPRGHVAGRTLPVLIDIYGGPDHQEVVAVRGRWLERQWWADAGFAVVVIDNRGTGGVSPSFDKAIARRFADVILADQVDALAALADKHRDLDLSRVAIRGWSFGGWLSALAVLRRPDVYHCGVAGAPVTDWTMYDTAYTERYLGLPRDNPEVYAHNSLLESAAEPPAPGEPTRPLLLIHGLMDDNVVAAHTLKLSAALLTAGRPHAVIPLTGATHMAAGGLREQLLALELDFVRRNLPALVA